MENTTNRNCYFLYCLTYYDEIEFYTFFGKSSGTLSFGKRESQMKKAKSDLWYVFVPNNYDKTLAEMNDFERKNRNYGSASATEQFTNWYKNKYKIN